ncbi:hypothetical protein [Streptococcus sp. S784/96/1]|uniref:hypothetical protein n=1 Tax=Streptococcus sp. S784/96/1 TaxID=2653499 RepID=UPI001389A01B|nr:hypothetical protein [Streptococcus sp. S784/96/1]
MQVNVDDSNFSGYSVEAQDRVSEATKEYCEFLIKEVDRIEKSERTSDGQKEVIGSHVIKARTKLNKEYFPSKRDKIILGITTIVIAITSISVGSLWGSNPDTDLLKYIWFIISVALLMSALLIQFYYTAVK